MTDRIVGTVKWFSNKKGYGFITPDTPNADDVFVHQSVIVSEGYRTLSDEWRVEFSIGLDENGKPKAENVTAIGGGPCTGPRRSHHRRKGRGTSGTAAGEGKDATTTATFSTRTPQPLWHESLKEEVKGLLDSKHIARSTGTLDVSVGQARIKLGTRGYAAVAQQDRTIAEGSFSCDEEGDGIITLHWKRSIKFTEDGVWNAQDEHHLEGFVKEVDLKDEDVLAVGLEENMATLMGEDLPDPRSTLEAAGFEMRRVVLSTKKRGSV